MDFMKVIDQTVREIKREVNLKVLKVPEIEQKVLDATDDEPWGPHGTAMAEIAQATKKFSECSIVMNVLWTRLKETDKNWRYVYKALVVLEYLVAHGSERSVDEIVEHTYQISSLTKFEYVEPSGKDMGINVRKKAENIVSLLNDKDKIHEVRNKASANREKYFGLSSTGVTYKSGSASLSSGSRYGGFGNNADSDSFAYKERDRYGEDKFDQNTTYKSRREISEKDGSLNKGASPYVSKSQGGVSAGGSKMTNKSYSDKNASKPSVNSSTPSSNYDDDFDDFDPRGTSTAKPSVGSSNQVDLFGESLVGDLLDAPVSAPTDNPSVRSEVDLFADADFVSATPQSKMGGSSQSQTSVDLFAQPEVGGSSQPQTGIDLFSQPAPLPAPPSAMPMPQSSSIDFFSVPDPAVKSSKQEPMNTNIVDPFAAVPLNTFDSSDPFGSFVSQTDPPVSATPNETATSGLNQGNLNNSSVESKPPPKKDAFQVKSGIWADSLSRGLIDLNISAPKKVNLSDVGIVGGLTDGFEEKDKGPTVQTTFYMGRAMGQGSGLGKTGFTSNSKDDIFSSFSSGQQYGGFSK
ncbi:PREDICTED: clathrin interactor EPSIN 1 isoform X2 [Ipomoea nil]|uniref:clathrin interactor EPSIN 1 isoform X2 n=1 Tax=Ipomoea nil TaxID=35883 RepID=UPI0009008B44|nr:PREDICTED: clathrin interactor EPSIN 1 isoform X2 [Ipomoea nil]